MTGYAFKVILTNNPKAPHIAIGCGMTEEHRERLINDCCRLAEMLFGPVTVNKIEIENHDGGFGLWWS